MKQKLKASRRAEAMKKQPFSRLQNDLNDVIKEITADSAQQRLEEEAKRMQLEKEAEAPLMKVGKLTERNRAIIRTEETKQFAAVFHDPTFAEDPFAAVAAHIGSAFARHR
eukprot:ANDGO_02956.mRNA.1 hypothetical protein